MNKEVLSIVKNFETTLKGQPWFGRPVYHLLQEVDESKIHSKPNAGSHSLIELLWHMVTWAQFTLSRIDESSATTLAFSEEMDWRKIDPSTHTWQAGMNELRSAHDKIIAILKNKDDSFLSNPVDERKYNMRFLLNGLIQHNIYHAGQVAYLKKLLE